MGKETPKFVNDPYQLTFENLAETLASDRRTRLADAALQDTVQFPVITGQMLLDYDAAHLVRGDE